MRLSHKITTIDATDFQISYIGRKWSVQLLAYKAIPMPVRKIQKSHRSLTGVVPSTKLPNSSQFESSLERDFLHLLEFDSTVKSYEVQPLTIEYVDKQGKTRKYTPDVLVEYLQEPGSTPQRKVQIYEVKYRNELRANWSVLKPKFRAAINYCKATGREFRIITEREIRTDQLFNAQFLNPYKKAPIKADQATLLLESMKQLGLATPTQLLHHSSPDPSIQIELLHVLWYLVANRLIACDLSARIHMTTPLMHIN